MQQRELTGERLMLKWEELQQRNASARIFRGGCRIYIFTMQVSRHSILPMQNRNVAWPIFMGTSTELVGYG